MKTEFKISTNQNFFKEKADAYIIFLEQKSGFFTHEDFSKDPHLTELKKIYPHIEILLEKRGFNAKLSEIVALPISINQGHEMCILVGLGAKKENFVENYRRALATAIRSALSYGATSIVISLLAAEDLTMGAYKLGKETAIITEMTCYKHDDFLTTDGSKQKRFAQVILITENQYKNEMEKGLREGVIIGESVNEARYFVDTPPSHMTPIIVAKHAQEIAKKNSISYQEYNLKEIQQLKMGGLLGVARGSVEEPRFVKMEYKPQHAKNKQPILLVGKGITFDSGGLSIKPAQSMETMKDDMAGAAAVIMATAAASRLNLPIHIVALAPLTENMPSGTATKPGDVLTFYNGKTAEVKNTDAEGRLILADALSYGVKNYNPEFVIDLATLTGACAHALGPFYTGLFTTNETLAENLENAGQKSGDYVWRLPMGEDYRKAIKSTIADICNIGDSRVKAGGTTAAHFLEYFVGETPWAHLDIAGSAFDVPGIPYYAPGATGVGVRLLIELLKEMK